MPTAPARRTGKAERHRRYDKYRRDKEASEFYHGKEWRAARRTYLLSIGGIEQPNGRISAYCQRCGKWTDSPEVHHRREWKPNRELALDLTNLECRCKSCHSEDAGMIHGQRSAVTVLCGDIAAARARIKAEANNGDVVWDMDAVASAMGFPQYPRPKETASMLCAYRDELVRRIQRGQVRQRCWIIISDEVQATRIARSVDGRVVGC